MSKKVTVQEFCDFLNDKGVWLKGTHMDDTDDALHERLITYAKNGVASPTGAEATASLAALDGLFADYTRDFHSTIAVEFRKWQKKRDTVVIAIQVSKTNRDKIMAKLSQIDEIKIL